MARWPENADGGASGLVLPMRAVAAALRAVPALVAQPLGARGALQCCPRLELAAAKDLDALSFATKSTALAQAEPLLAEGGAAPGLTLLLSGRVALTAGRSGGVRRAVPRVEGELGRQRATTLLIILGDAGRPAQVAQRMALD